MTSPLVSPSYRWSYEPRPLSPAGAWLALLLLLLAGLALGCSMFDSGMGEARELQRVGLPAQAEILSIGETGLSINHDPVITLGVEVRPPDRPPYQATIKRLLVSRLEIPQFQPGRVIPVRYDPKDPSRVSFDLGPPKAAKTGNPFADNFEPQREYLASLEPAPPTPALYRGSLDDRADMRGLIENDYVPLGVSSFKGDAADPGQAAQQGQKLGAAVVVLYGEVLATPDAALTPLPFHPRPPGGDSASAAPTADTAGAQATIGSLPQWPASDHEATYWAKSQPPVLGVIDRPLNEAERASLMRNDGLVVELVSNGSPAAAAHLQQGDVIVAIDGKTILDPLAVPAFLQSIAGRKVRIDLLRGGTPQAVEVQLNPAAPDSRPRRQ
jgi:PDZ domain